MFQVVVDLGGLLGWGLGDWGEDFGGFLLAVSVGVLFCELVFVEVFFVGLAVVGV